MKKSVRKPRRKFDIKKTPLYKLLMICVVILILLLLIWAGIKINERVEEKELEGELGEMGIFREGFQETGIVRANCSYENLQMMWDEIFEQESSVGIISITDTSGDDSCNYSLNYKILDENTAYFIWANYDEEDSYVYTQTRSFYGNFTPSFITTLQDTTPSYLSTFYSNYLRYVDDADYRYVQGFRNISNSNEANQEYDNTFKIENGSWYNDNPIYNPAYYYFYDDSILNPYPGPGDYVYSRNARVFHNQTLDYLYYMAEIIKPINLTQIQNIPDKTINESDAYADQIFLNDYFENTGMDYNLSFDYSVSPAGIVVDYFEYLQYINFNTADVLNGTFMINITLSHPYWNSGENVTSNNFYLTVNGCLDPDGRYDYYTKGTSQNSSTSLTDSCSGNDLIEYYCYNSNIKSSVISCGADYCSDGTCVINTSVEHLPSFNSSACDDLEWEVNTNYVLNMEKCWYDLDGDALSGFRYENSTNNKNLTIIQNSNNLTLTPDTNWVGDGYFYVYANDSKNESRGEIDFDVVNSIAINNTNITRTNTTAPVTNEPKITSSSPSDNEVYMFLGNKTFTISASDYQTIKWYLNGKEITEAAGVLSYNFSDLKEGDIVKVDVINGTRIDSKTWTIKIEKDEEGETPVFDIGTVIFYSIIAILGIIILLVVWLFVIEKNKKNREIGIGIGFGVSNSGGRSSSDLDYFNIPE